MLETTLKKLIPAGVNTLAKLTHGCHARTAP
jgi:hypothetical protein